MGAAGSNAGRNSSDGKPVSSTDILEPMAQDSRVVDNEQGVRIGVAPGGR